MSPFSAPISHDVPVKFPPPLLGKTWRLYTCARTILGLPWIIHGLSMDFSLVFPRISLYYCCTIPELSVDYPGTIPWLSFLYYPLSSIKAGKSNLLLYEIFQLFFLQTGSSAPKNCNYAHILYFSIKMRFISFSYNWYSLNYSLIYFLILRINIKRVLLLVCFTILVIKMSVSVYH